MILEFKRLEVGWEYKNRHWVCFLSFAFHVDGFQEETAILGYPKSYNMKAALPHGSFAWVLVYLGSWRFFFFLSRHWKCFWMALVIAFSCNKEILWQHWPRSCWLNGQKFIPRWERTNFPCPLNQWLLSAASLAWSQALRNSQRCASLRSLGMGVGLLFSNGGPRSATPAHLREMRILRRHPWEVMLHGQGWEPRSRLRTAELAQRFSPCFSQEQMCSSR